MSRATPVKDPTPTSRKASQTATGTGNSKTNDVNRSNGGTPASSSAAAYALSAINSNRAGGPSSIKRPALAAGHGRVASWSSPPAQTKSTFGRGNGSKDDLGALSAGATKTTFTTLNSPTESQEVDPLMIDRTRLLLYTYRASAVNPAVSQPSPLPSKSSFNVIPASNVLLCHAALPFDVVQGDYLEIRRIKSEHDGLVSEPMPGPGPGPDENRIGGEALRGLKHKSGHDGFIFRVGQDQPHIPTNQIHVPETVQSAFDFRLRSEVEIIKVKNVQSASIDYIELRFSQYLGRADMWRLGMSLENSTIHVGERISLAGGAVRAEVHGIWRGQHKYASGIFTAKTKTIYRSRSAQVYIFIQLCRETWEFDEDGERYSEKVVHGFLPELFGRWGNRSISHLVTIIFFARIHYDESEIAYMERHGLTAGLMKDYAGRPCKDFFRVAIDFERRSDWKGALSEIKQCLERSEKEILLDFHLSRSHKPGDATRILGKWSFAYEGNVLEAVNLALNPFDEHYIDRDLSRTGLNLTIITPGTGHFAVDKNLLRLTTERMIDVGIGLDLVCLTKMPLHSVPLFSYVSQKPKKNQNIIRPQSTFHSATPDLLYFDAHLSSAVDTELADCYSIPKWVWSSFYAKTHDKPFRKDRFVPRCKMYDIQMLGILDHNLTTVTVPFIQVDDGMRQDTMQPDQRKAIRDQHDSNLFKLADSDTAKGSSAGASLGASYQSTRLLAVKSEEQSKSSRSNSNQIGSLSPERSKLSFSPSRRSPLGNKETLEPLALGRTEVRAASPAPSSLSMGLSRATSPPPKTIETINSGQSTPRTTPHRLKNKSSKSSFASRFGSNWLIGALSGRSQPSFPAAAVETVGRQDVSTTTGSELGSPTSVSVSRQMPSQPVITPSTPSPAKDFHTQPVPIASRRPARHTTSDDNLAKSHKESIKFSRSPGDSWAKAANFNKGKYHIAVNPCNPKENMDNRLAPFKRWQHLRPKSGRESQHLVKWTSLTAPACLPLTTDFMPTPLEIQEFYELNSYDIACYPDQVSFLVRSDAAHVNLPLAVMREMASQRLSQNFQFIVLPHNHKEDEDGKISTTRKVLLPGDSTKDGLRVGGASEVLRDANGAIYLLWSNHIHRLAFDPAKQSVTIQRFVRKLKHSMDPVKYKCLVWPFQTKGYQEAEATFKYPNIDAKLNFNYLDRLIAGEEDQFTSSLRYWRTRYLLIPSGKDPLSVQGVVPKGEQFDPSEILITGAFKVLEILGKYQWKRPGQQAKPLRLLPTTFDPSACILDDGLMTELERLQKGEEQMDVGKALEGMTLQTVADMMCQPNNGLIIRDRWWNFKVHEDSFTGEQFVEWLLNTFTDVKTLDEAAEWGKSLLEKGLIEHVTAAHGFVNYGHFFYRLRNPYDVNAHKRKKPKSSWFGGRPTQDPRDLIERHATLSVSPSANAPLGKLGGDLANGGLGLSGIGNSGSGSGNGKRKKIKMSQNIIVDLDPGRKSDRAEVAILHADIIHNERNAFHFELDWLGVTAGLLEDLRSKCSTQAERYGLRFIEAPVGQIKDIPLKCAYRSPIHIPLALAPPIIPDLHLRLADYTTGQSSNYFEYAILTRKFGFVLDVEASSRYPETVEVEYTYRGREAFEYSQFCHRTGLALVQCVGGEKGFLWSDNRLFIAAPVRGRGGSTEMYPNAPVPARLTKQEEAKQLRAELEAFCSDKDALKAFYEEVMPPPRGTRSNSESQPVNIPTGEKSAEVKPVENGGSSQGEAATANVKEKGAEEADGDEASDETNTDEMTKSESRAVIDGAPLA